MKIKWINRYSLDFGYVCRIKKDHFENTSDISKAKIFKSDEITLVLEQLTCFENNNDYIAIDVDSE